MLCLSRSRFADFYALLYIWRMKGNRQDAKSAKSAKNRFESHRLAILCATGSLPLAARANEAMIPTVQTLIFVNRTANSEKSVLGALGVLAVKSFSRRLRTYAR